jgi:uncharacterized protein
MSFARKRVVFDTSTLIGALLFPHSNHAKTFREIITQHQLVASAETLQELVDVIARPKFDRYRAITERAEFVKRYSDIVELVTVTETVNDCRDEKDNKFLALALAASATVIISSDDDLLVLNPYRDIEVVEIADFAIRHLST